MAGHTVSVKWLIRLNYICIALFVILFAIVIHSGRGYIKYEREQMGWLVAQSEADRAQMKVDLESYVTKDYLEKTYVKSKDLMPSVFIVKEKIKRH